MAYKDKYKSIQLNISLKKHKDMLDWLAEAVDDEESSFNSIIIRMIKKEYRRRGEKEND